MKWASKEWCHCVTPKPKQFCTQASAGKVILVLSWRHQGPLIENYTGEVMLVLSWSHQGPLIEHYAGEVMLVLSWDHQGPLIYMNIFI
jgi:hypothetical protein